MKEAQGVRIKKTTSPRHSFHTNHPGCRHVRSALALIAAPAGHQNEGFHTGDTHRYRGRHARPLAHPLSPADGLRSGSPARHIAALPSLPARNTPPIGHTWAVMSARRQHALTGLPLFCFPSLREPTVTTSSAFFYAGPFHRGHLRAQHARRNDPP